MDITREWLEEILGVKVRKFLVSPKFKNEKCLGLNIDVEAEQELADIPIKVSFTPVTDSDFFGDDDEISSSDFEKLGFKYQWDPFKGKYIWGLGHKVVSSMNVAMPEIIYDVERQECEHHNGEFSNISRKCETIEEVEKFVNCCIFLFDLNLDLNKKVKE